MWCCCPMIDLTCDMVLGLLCFTWCGVVALWLLGLGGWKWSIDGELKLNADELMLLSASNCSGSSKENVKVEIKFLESHLQHSQLTLSFARSQKSMVAIDKQVWYHHKSQPSQQTACVSHPTCRSQLPQRYKMELWPAPGLSCISPLSSRMRENMLALLLSLELMA